MFQDSLSVPYSRVKEPKKNLIFRLKMGPIGCPETLATTNQHCITYQKSDDLIYTTAEA
jgi:hypothetical protein